MAERIVPDRGPGYRASMPTLSFSKNIQTHVDVDRWETDAATVGESLESIFARRPKLRGYLLDDRGAVRKHVAIFVNGTSIADREKLTDPVSTSDEIFVMQALSGG